jgi:hypothetical protein
VTYLQGIASEHPRSDRSFNAEIQKTVEQPEAQTESHCVYKN